MPQTPEQKRKARANLRKLPHVVEAASMSRPMEDWIRFRNCAGMDIKAFFPPQGGGKGMPRGADRYVYARAACNGCAVKAHCLLDTLRWESSVSSTSGRFQRAGFAGGLSPEDRRYVESFVIGVRGVRDAVSA